MTAKNRLTDAASPYLRQHADNPVHWYAWGNEAFAAAQAENKPVLLSGGYSACHWCHVMARESFADPKIADIMNRHFINIKLDREERPDIDHLYQQALALMGEPGGWPMTMFLTPDGAPFFGGTYFPPQAMHGRPGFAVILQGIADSWQTEQDKIEYNIAAVTQALRQEAKSRHGEIPDQARLTRTAQKLITGFDPKYGGFGSAPKFPQAPLVDFLWRYSRVSDDDIYQKASLITLHNICQGGIYDHIGGGFFRYSMDQYWRVPHFEKMLNDNALMLRLLAAVYPASRSPLYKMRIEETIEWIMSDMKIKNREVFAAALDADSPDTDGTPGEGAFYLWDDAEIDKILDENDPSCADFRKIYDLQDNGHINNQFLPNRLKHQEIFNDKKENRLREIKHRMKATRRQRAHPQRDDKILTDWNAMTVVALAECGMCFDNTMWVDQAIRTYDAIKSDGALCHARMGDTVLSDALLEDYAWMMTAANSLYQITGEDRYLTDSREFFRQAQEKLADTEDHGFFMAAEAANPLVRQKTINDTASPSGNAVMLTAILTLNLLDPSADMAETAEKLLACFAGEIDLAPNAMGGYLTAAQIRENHATVTIKTPDTKTYKQIAVVCFQENCNTTLILRYEQAEKNEITICRNQTCHAPVYTIEALREVLKTL